MAIISLWIYIFIIICVCIYLIGIRTTKKEVPKSEVTPEQTVMLLATVLNNVHDPNENIIDTIPIELQVPSPGHYHVIEYPNFISDELCEQLKMSAESNFKPSKVYSINGVNEKMVYESRISKTATFHNIYSQQVSEHVANWTKIPVTYQEKIQVTKYEENGKFDYHHDTNPKNRLRQNWSRMITVMIYLNGGPNDSLVGGETEFKYINKSIKPEKGKAVLFWSVRPTEKGGELIMDSVHRGSVVKRGEKWICNIWIHSEPSVSDARYQ